MQISYKTDHQIAHKAINEYRNSHDFDQVLKKIFPIHNISRDNWLEKLLWRNNGGLRLLKKGLKDVWLWEELDEAKEMLDIIDLIITD